MTTKLRQRHATLISSHHLRPWLLSTGLLVSGCYAQDWAMGLGQESSEPSSGAESSGASQDPSQGPGDGSPPGSAAPTGNASENETQASKDSTEPEDQSPDQGSNTSSGAEDTLGSDEDSTQQDPGPDVTSTEPSPDSSNPDSETSEPNPQPDVDDTTQEQDPSVPRCGDGRVQGDEECDDGNTVETDACLPNCRRARCGDMVVWEGHEACDPGPDGNATQMATCAQVCGQFSEPILEARPPTRTCYAKGERACQVGAWDCRGCREPRPFR